MSAVTTRYLSRIGERVGMLVFVGIANNRGDGNRVIGIFSCDCGKTTKYPVGRILNSHSRNHCGCKTDHGAHRTHGMRNSREYSTWLSMKARCLDKGNKDYPRWGGRGITIYKQWINSFEAFFEYIGHRPDGTTLDRIDTTRGYEPGNVRWATAKEQQRNRLTSYRWHIKGLVFDGGAHDARRPPSPVA